MTSLQKKSMTIETVIILALIGLSAGVLSGLVGIGGGIVIVPALVFFMSYTQHQAQGTSLGILSFPVVLLAFLQYYYGTRGMGAPIDWRVIGIMAVAFFIGDYFGSQLALKIDQKMLKKIFAIILIFSALKLLEWDKMIVKGIKSIF